MTTPEGIEAGGAPSSTPAPEAGAGLWRRSPRWLFHLMLVPPVFGLLWSVSAPGTDVRLWSGSLVALALGALVWVARSIGYLLVRRAGRHAGRGRWFLVAPVAGILALALVRIDAPLRVRWAMSRSDFEAVAQEAMRNEREAMKNGSVPDPIVSRSAQRLGLYEVSGVYRAGEGGVVFYESTAALPHGAGFAYLPYGRLPEPAGARFGPEFRHFEGPWYTWTVNWATRGMPDR